jgi:hypothetical protein
MWAPFPVPWDWPVLLGAMLGVETCFLGAGLLAPLLVLSTQLSDLGGVGAVTDAQLVEALSAPENFWKILLTAEMYVALRLRVLLRLAELDASADACYALLVFRCVRSLQTGTGCVLLYNLLQPYAPLPEGVLELRLRPRTDAEAAAAAAAAAQQRKAAQQQQTSGDAVASALGLPRRAAPLPAPPPPVEDDAQSWARTAGAGAAVALGGVALLTALALLLGIRGAEARPTHAHACLHACIRIRICRCISTTSPSLTLLPLTHPHHSLTGRGQRRDGGARRGWRPRGRGRAACVDVRDGARV